MRRAIALLTLAAMAACAAAGARLTPADSATALMTGGPITMTISPPVQGGDGQDPLILMTLTAQDGRVMQFAAANHTPYDTMAQAPGGPLAQAMGYFGDEAPTLYQRREGGQGAPFICAPDGPRMIGVYQASDGEVSIAGLRVGFGFEPRDDGSYEALPYSPDMVCGRLKFRRR